MLNLKIALISAIFCIIAINPLRAADIYVNNPGQDKDIQPEIQKAADAASNGDRLILPSGHFIVNKSVVVTKFISIIGQGIRSTTLYRSEEVSDLVLSKNREWRAIFKFILNSPVPSNIVVSGICFKSKKPSIKEGDGGSLAADIGIEFVECIDFIVTRCRFEGFGDAGINIIHNDSLASGVIFKNEFFHNAKGPEALGLGYGITVYGLNRVWITDPGLGSARFIFIEDNIFDYHRHSVAAGGCGLYVFRHNKVLNNVAGQGGHAIDVHSARGSSHGLNSHGTRAVEIYNNELVNTTYTDGSLISKTNNNSHLEETGINIRSGDAVVYNNTIKGYRFAVGISNYLLQDNPPPSYPALETPGYLSGLNLGPDHSGVKMPAGDGDLFCWNNKLIPLRLEYDKISSVFHNFGPQWWREGRDYHLVPKPGYRPYPYPHPLRKKLLPRPSL